MHASPEHTSQGPWAQKPMNQEPDDSTLDLHISVLLRTGTTVSAAVIFFGGVLFLFQHARSIPDYRTFHGLPARFSTLSGIFHDAFQLHPLGIIQLGLLLLIATPVARVLFSVIAFWLERDHLYVVISGIVLVILFYSLFVHAG